MEENFKSLDWLRNGIRYVLEVVAALSILLLTLGLVSASWNFLDKDKIFGNAPMLQSLWGLDQALAIDANLPLVFVFLFAAVKNRDWVKMIIYTVIGAMLLFVAATILDMESLRQALNIPLEAAALQVRVSMGVITQVRSFATIGLVAMSGLTWTMLIVKGKKSTEDAPAEPAPAPAPAESTEPFKDQPEKKDLGDVEQAAPRKRVRKTISNGSQEADKYQQYLELVSITPEATITLLAEKLGVSKSTISNYRRKSKSNELEVYAPALEEANV